MFFIFLFSTPKVFQIGACGYFFSKNLGPFFTVDFSYLLGASSNCLTCLRVEPALSLATKVIFEILSLGGPQVRFAQWKTLENISHFLKMGPLVRATNASGSEAAIREQ
jgi:hypothetical protein